MNAANESAEVRKARLDRAFDLRDQRWEREGRGSRGEREQSKAVLAAMVTFLLAGPFGVHGRITETQVQSAIEGARLILKSVSESERKAGSMGATPRA